MSVDKPVDPIRQAEIEISAVLARLEAETGRFVQDLRLSNIDVTRIDTEGKELLSGVRIELRREAAQRRWESRP